MECFVTMDLVWMIMTHCCRFVCIIFFFLRIFGVAPRDDRSHMGGSDDMKSLVIIGGVCGSVWDSYLFLRVYTRLYIGIL